MQQGSGNMHSVEYTFDGEPYIDAEGNLTRDVSQLTVTADDGSMYTIVRPEPASYSRFNRPSFVYDIPENFNNRPSFFEYTFLGITKPV